MPLPKTPPRASRKNRLPISLHPTLDHKLLGYAAAAGAAGVGILALAKPSQAEIVYTPTHQTVPPSLALDLNNDGITDFTISNYSWSCPSGVCRFQQLVVYPTGRNRVLATSAAGAYAQALQADKRVGPGPNFRSSAKMDFCKASRQKLLYLRSVAFREEPLSWCGVLHRRKGSLRVGSVERNHQRGALRGQRPFDRLRV